MEDTKTHHLYGGSTAKYWVNCSGWASLVKDMPYEPAGPAALKGTALHVGILEVKTQQEINSRINGTPIKIDYSGIEHWPEEGAEMADDFWNRVWVNVLEEIITGKKIYIEHKIMLDEELDSGGTADFVCLYYNDKAKLVAVVGDLKTGRVRVEPNEEQLKFYLAAIYKKAKASGKEIEEFRSFIYQPTHDEPYSEHKFSKSEIVKALTRYEKAIADSKKDKPKFKVGDHCQYCKAQARCKAYNKHIDDMLSLTVTRKKDVATLTPPEALSDEVLKNIVLYSSKIKNYLSAVKKEAILRFMSGNPIEGLAVINGSSRRKFGDEEKAIEVFTKIGIKPTKEVLRGLGEMKDELKKIGLRPKDIDTLLNPLLVKSDPPPRIVEVGTPGTPYVFKDAAALLEEYDSDGYLKETEE